MASALVVGDIHVGPEQRVMQVVEAPVDGHTVKVPVIAINGKREGPRVAITGGVHGVEYVGIEAARRLGTEIDPADVAGSLIVVPIANTVAFHKGFFYKLRILSRCQGHFCSF